MPSEQFEDLGVPHPRIEYLGQREWSLLLEDPYDRPQWSALVLGWTLRIRVEAQRLSVVVSPPDTQEAIWLPIPKMLQQLPAPQREGDEQKALEQAWRDGLLEAVCPLLLDLLRERRSRVEEEWVESGRPQPIELSAFARHQRAEALLHSPIWDDFRREEALVLLVLDGKVDVLDAAGMGSTSENLTVALACRSDEGLRRLKHSRTEAWHCINERQRDVVRRTWDPDQTFERSVDDITPKKRLQLWEDPTLVDVLRVSARQGGQSLTAALHDCLLAFVAAGPAIPITVVHRGKRWGVNIRGRGDEFTFTTDIQGVSDHLIEHLGEDARFALSFLDSEGERKTLFSHSPPITASEIPAALQTLELDVASRARSHDTAPSNLGGTDGASSPICEIGRTVTQHRAPG